MSDNLREQLLLLPAYFQGHLMLTLAAISMGAVSYTHLRAHET